MEARRCTLSILMIVFALTGAVVAAEDSEPDLADSVLRLEGGSVDLAPVFYWMEDGSYMVRVSRPESWDATASFEVVIAPGGNTMLEDQEAGLYEITVSPSDTEDPFSAWAAWALLLPGDSYEQAAGIFEDVKAELESQDPQPDRATRRATLQKALQQIADGFLAEAGTTAD